MSPRDDSFDESMSRGALTKVLGIGIGVVIVGVTALVGGFVVYHTFRVEIAPLKVGVLIRKTGLDLPNDQEIATDPSFKGVQLEVLKEGRDFFNPYTWDVEIHDQVEVPEGHVGLLIRHFGDDLPHQQLLALTPEQKGIVPDPLRPGRYPDYSNPHAYTVVTRPAVTVPAGFKGVVTLVTGTPAQQPNQVLVEQGERGVQRKVLEPGTYYVNPYVEKVSLVDCRTKRHDLAEEQDMGFPSKDGFWIRLDGAIQFHIDPQKCSEVFVMYNDARDEDDASQEIVEKVILPNARSFCRLAGSNYTGRQFIEGKAREEFQTDFEKKMKAECGPHGVIVDSALITRIFPPERIAEPARKREIARQEQEQYLQEIKQQDSEAKLIGAKMKVEQKKRLIEAKQKIAEQKTKAMEEQQVAKTGAEKSLSVAKTRLEAAKDQAAAVVSKGTAEAKVIELENRAAVSGIKASVDAYGGDGRLFAQQVLYEKLAPNIQKIMTNSADSPIMRIFEQFQEPSSASRSAAQGSSPSSSAQTMKGATP